MAKSYLSASEVENLVGAANKSTALTRLHKLLGSNWTKGTYSDSVPHGKEMTEVFCLVGGLRHIDGEAQDEATSAVANAVRSLYPDRCGFANPDKTVNDEYPWPSFGVRADWKDPASVADFISDVEVTADDRDAWTPTNTNERADESTIIDFNDHAHTKHKDVLKVIEAAQKGLEPKTPESAAKKNGEPCPVRIAVANYRQSAKSAAEEFFKAYHAATGVKSPIQKPRKKKAKKGKKKSKKK